MRFVILAMFFFILQTAIAGTPYVPPRVLTEPVIDGSLEDDVWKEALIISDFYQRLPKEGAAPTERTEVRMLYTANAMYIAFTAFDSNTRSLNATVLKRDDFDIVRDDQFTMAIDSYNDARNGYWFSTNPIGARVDSQFFDEGNIWEPNWNAIWRCETKIDSFGWSAELEIPFSTLRFRPAETNIMGINFFRRIIRTNEQLFSPLIPLKYANGTPNVSAARKYLFRGITGGKDWLIQPHAVSGLEGGENFKSDFDGDGGADVKYALTDSLTSNVSLNMDFAEAEVDQRQIQLSRFRLFFPEKRDFFLENAGNFQFGIPGQTELFFSRRIGLSDEGETTVPVLFGAKLTGKIRRLDLGILNSQTKESNGAPAQNFSVVRLKSAVGERSYVGSILTARADSGHNFASTLGIDTNLFLFGETTLSGFISRTAETKMDEGYAYHAALSRGGERTSYRVAFTQLDESFVPAIGFLQRTGVRQFKSTLALPYYFQKGFLRTITPSYEGTMTEDLREDFTDRFHRASLKFITPAEDQLMFFTQHLKEGVPEEFPIFRDVMVRPGTYSEMQTGFEFTSKPGRKVSGSLFLSTGGFYGGAKTEITPSIQWKLNRHFTFAQLLSTNGVEFDQESFRIYLVRSQISYSLNTHFSTSAIVQYDNSTREVGINFRAVYLFREGTELYVVYDDLRERGRHPHRPIKDRRRLLMKFTYLFAF